MLKMVTVRVRRSGNAVYSNSKRLLDGEDALEVQSLN